MEPAISQQAEFSTSTVLLAPASVMLVGTDHDYLGGFAAALESSVPSWTVRRKPAEELLGGRVDVSGFDVFLIDGNDRDAEVSG